MTKVRDNIAIVALGTLPMFMAMFALQSSDVYMYLALARDFILNGNWTFHDPYLYSLSGARLDWAHEYLSYLLFHFAGAWGGIPEGLVVLKILIVALTAKIVLAAEPRAINRSALWYALFFLAVFAASFRFIERASLISDLATVWLASTLLTHDRISRGLIARLTLLFLVWVQFHPGFPIGFLLIGVWAAYHARAGDISPRELAWLACPLLAVILNPLGIEGALYPFGFAMNEAQTLKQYNFEWMAAYSRPFRFAPEVLAFWLLGLLCAYVIARERAYKTLRALFALIAFAMAANAVRFIPWAAFVMILSVRPWAVLKHIRTPLAVEYLLAALTFAFGLKCAVLGYNSSSGFRHPLGGKPDPAFIPSHTVEFLKANRIPGSLYNTHDLGAYLIWQNATPVFHHGFVTDMDFYKNDVMGVFQGQARFLELAQKYGWTMLLIEKKNSWAYFHHILSPLTEWKIVAEDEAAYLVYKLPGSRL